MFLSQQKLNQLNYERPQYSDRFHRRAFKSKTSSDLIKGIVEIIKNSVDAYINEKGQDKCDKEHINIILDTKNKIIKIVNFAQGMNSTIFQKALRVAEDTSSDKEAVTGAHGYGMKEAAWAFKQTRIISVTKDKYTSRIFFWDENEVPNYAWEKDTLENEIVDFSLSKKIQEDTGIEKEGTYFEALFPEDIGSTKPETLAHQLANHILLRTINQSNKFNIVLSYNDKNDNFSSLKIEYTLPEIESIREDRKEIDIGKFSFEYPGYGIINCNYEIYLSPRELTPTGDIREAGLLICAGPFSVLDCTLFEHGDRIANRFFGRVMLSGAIREITKKERIIDDRRETGLLKKTPLYINLYNVLHQKLEILIEKERKRINKKVGEVSKGVLDNKLDLIKEFNRIDKQEEESTTIISDIKFIPGPNGIRFCRPDDYLKLMERVAENVHIVIDTNMIPFDTEILINSNKEGIKFDPPTFKVDKIGTDKDGVFKKKISFISETIETFLVTAQVRNMLNKAELNIDVIKDPRLNIKEAIEFVPSEQDIVSGKSKNFDLIINAYKIDPNNKLEIKHDNYFNINSHISFKEASRIYNNFYELKIPIYCSGKPRQKGEVQALVKSFKATLKLNIIDKRDRHLKGDFEGIDEDKIEDPEELGYYDKKTKIIYICVNHPILRHYKRNKENENNLAYRLLYADVIIKEFCKALTRKKVKIFENTTAEDYRVRFDNKFNELYKKHSVRLHRFCIAPENIEALKINK